MASFRATLAHQHHCSRGECWPASCRPQSRLIAALVVCVRSAPLQKETAPPLALSCRKSLEPVGWPERSGNKQLNKYASALPGPEGLWRVAETAIST